MYRQIIIVLLGLILAACSSTSGNNTSGPGRATMADNTAQTQGVGSQEQLAGQNVDEQEQQAANQRVYHFSFDNSDVQTEDVPGIKAQAHYLVEHPTARVVLSGHTDERGSREYNIGLGERRAISIANMLRFNGVNDEQIRIVSFGKEKPIALAHNENAYRENRRVELKYERE